MVFRGLTPGISITTDEQTLNVDGTIISRELLSHLSDTAKHDYLFKIISRKPDDVITVRVFTVDHSFPEENNARAAYEAYRAYSEGRSLVSGSPIPPFEELSQEIRNAWIVAAEAVRRG